MWYKDLKTIKEKNTTIRVGDLIETNSRDSIKDVWVNLQYVGIS